LSEEEGRLLSCSAVLDGEYGFRSISLGVPVVIGKGGIHRIVQWALPADERQDLENAAQPIREGCRFVRETVGSSRR
jgi:malate dehydrogenase